jgi:uncharacterized protein YbjT (DUF2867 family)
MSLTKITLTGAGSLLGGLVLDRLVAAGFSVTVLRRAGSTATFSVPTVDADFSSLDSLKTALAGQDAVVSTVGTAGLEAQLLLVEAAAAAGVRRFLPSEYGSNLDNPKTRVLPVYAHKVAVQERLFALAREGGGTFSYTLVYNAAFLDWGIDRDFLLSTSKSKPVLFDGGNAEFGAATLATVADAVLGVLRHPDETKNRTVRIREVVTTQRRLLEYAKQAAPSRPWQVSEARLDDLTAAAEERLKGGDFGLETMTPFLLRGIFDASYGANFVDNDNELSGITEKSDDIALAIFKKHLGV